MSGLADAADWAGVTGVKQDAGLIVRTERLLGQLVLQEHAVAGSTDPFAVQVFELKEIAETIALEPQTRVYEELVIRVQHGERDEVVSAVLRREQAEVTVTGKVGGVATRLPA